ncbi:MAG TPA: aspartate kinase [Planctomycetota bacterium]|nr:aspartate kinase [Planctomycetota bacterium]
MQTVVMKFGGTSVADAARCLSAAQLVVQEKLKGSRVVAVVSARGDTTDDLYKLAYEISDNPSRRELDMLVSTGEQISVALMAIAVHKLGHEAISLTGAQMGIITDNSFTKARIAGISPTRVIKELEDGKIVIAAGFQGTTMGLEITTLGRGGSDTTAVALAAALQADMCEFYKDVDGIFTADPRIVPGARKLDSISHDEMLELASTGAGVLHSRAIELAKKFRVPLSVRSSFNSSPGTVIIAEVPKMESVIVRGAAINDNEAKVTVLGVPDQPGIASKILEKVCSRNINLDMIVQNVGRDGKADVTFTVMKTDVRDALDVCNQAAKELGAEGVTADDNISKISVVGVGMRSHSGVAAKMFKALADQKINILMISTSEIKISCVVDKARGADALRAVHAAFELDKPEDERSYAGIKHLPGTKIEE